jgi:hypothetical protein
MRYDYILSKVASPDALHCKKKLSVRQRFSDGLSHGDHVVIQPMKWPRRDRTSSALRVPGGWIPVGSAGPTEVIIIWEHHYTCL